MVKVFLTSAAGWKSDLFPEQMTLREVLDHFDIRDAGAVNTADGEEILDEDLDKPLHRFGKDSVVRITSLPKPAEGPVSFMTGMPQGAPEGLPVEAGVHFTDAEPADSQKFGQVSLEEDKYREALRALSELRDALDAVRDKLKQAELPF